MTKVQLHDEALEQEIRNLPDETYIIDRYQETSGIFIPESDYGFAEIYRIYDNILVFLIPMYGGTPAFYKAYGLHAIDALVNDLRNLT